MAGNDIDINIHSDTATGSTAQDRNFDNLSGGISQGRAGLLNVLSILADTNTAIRKVFLPLRKFTQLQAGAKGGQLSRRNPNLPGAGGGRGGLSPRMQKLAGAATGVAVGFAIVTAAVKVSAKIWKGLNEQADKFKNFIGQVSPDVQRAEARARVNELRAAIQQSRDGGGEAMGRIIEARSDLKIAINKLRGEFVELIEPFIVVTTKSLTTMVEAAEAVIWWTQWNEDLGVPGAKDQQDLALMDIGELFGAGSRDLKLFRREQKENRMNAVKEANKERKRKNLPPLK